VYEPTASTRIANARESVRAETRDPAHCPTNAPTTPPAAKVDLCVDLALASGAEMRLTVRRIAQVIEAGAGSDFGALAVECGYPTTEDYRA
jgi:hypothetical protein